MENKEEMILVEMGDGTRRMILKSKYPLAQKDVKRLKELAIKGGWSKEKAEEVYSIWIVKENK